MIRGNRVVMENRKGLLCDEKSTGARAVSLAVLMYT